MRTSEIMAIISGDGGNVNNRGKLVSLKSGYQVSIKDGKIVRASNVGLILHIINGMLSSKRKNEYIGLWIENGKCFIDTSRRVATKKEAIALGMLTKQIAIWDNKKLKEIRL